MACRGQTFSFQGRYFDLEGIEPSPCPVQRPHPPFYMVANSPSSLDDAGDKGLPIFLHGALDAAAAASTSARYRTRRAAAGLAPRGEDVLLNRFVLVAESDARALEIMRGPFMEFLDRRAPDLRRYLEKTHGAWGADFDFLAREICIFGDADRCAERLAELHERAGVEHVLCTFNLITLDHARCVDSMARFSRDVVPRLRRRIGEAPGSSRTEVMAS
jgi:alkanesulfonate monooxygenase SsuD/methylene tetrahydromethanopterin reductase-like flavin-dependent oxidoreductase (luciferase family)